MISVDKKQETLSTYNRGALQLTAKFNGTGPRTKDIKKALSYGNKPNPVILELGCGNGRDAKEILKYSTNYIGVDYSIELIRIAEKDCPGGNFKVVDFEDWQFPKNLDIIFAFASLLHSDKDQLQTLLEKSAQALNSAGVFFISLKYAPYHEERKTEEIGSRTFYFYTPADVISLCPPTLESVYQDIQNLKGQQWFSLILQKN